MSDLIERLEKIKRNKRKGHEAIVQVKVPIEMRETLLAALKSDGLTVKDLFLAAIEQYLNQRK